MEIISVEEARKILGPSVITKTDKEIEEIIKFLYKLSVLTIDTIVDNEC